MGLFWGFDLVHKTGDPTEYCGDELADKEFSDPVIIGDEKTVWECYD
jgi:hypothetical protein